MKDWFFSDMSWLFFTTWSLIVAAFSYTAFRGDLEPSQALSTSRNESSSRASSIKSSAQ